MSTTNKTTTEVGFDPRTQQMRNWGYDVGQQVAGQKYAGYSGPQVAGFDPRYTQAVQGGLAGYGQLAQGLGGNLGLLQQLAQNPAQFTAQTAAQYMNPYTATVEDATRAEYDRARQLGLAQVNAGMGGAFGRASRGGVAQGRMLADLGQQQASTIAGLQQQGFSDAYNRWAQEQANRQGMLGGLVNLGIGGLQQGTQLGMQYGDQARQLQQQQYDVNRQQFEQQRDWASQHALAGAQAALPFMNYGTQTTTNTQRSSMLPGLLGGALTLGSMFIPGAGPALGALNFAGNPQGVQQAASSFAQSPVGQMPLPNIGMPSSLTNYQYPYYPR